MKTIARTFYKMRVTVLFFTAVPLFFFLFVLAYRPFDIERFLSLGNDRYTLNLIICTLITLGVMTVSRILLFLLRRTIDLNWPLYILWCTGEVVACGLFMSIPMGIGWAGIKKIFMEDPESLPIPGALALIAAVVSIVVKEGMYHYTRAAAKKIDSPALMADAWHHRSDALSSIGAAIGIGGARLGLPILDPIASLVICVMIAKAAYDIFRDAVSKMVDQSCDEDTEEAIRGCAMAHEGVKRVDQILTRRFGNRVYIEMEIAMDGSLSLWESHAIAERVHADVEAAFPEVKHIMIHVNPITEE